MEATSRSGKELIAATRAFAAENRAQSWWYVLSTFALLAGATLTAGFAPWWPLRIAAGALECLLLVRAFIFFHDFQHGSLLRGSVVARALFWVHGILNLTPARIWSETHNTHHANTARLAAPPTGTVALWTVERWQRASRAERLGYVVERHPLTLALAHVTVFFYNMCLLSFVRAPRRHWTSGLAVLVHVGIIAALWHFFGGAVLLSAFLGPMFVAYAFGAYLFYAQHNFPEVAIRDDDEWTYVAAALEASSYLRCGPVMSWFIGNINYHHVHHLNARIPFYRLPEAMAALPELQRARTTTLAPADVLACLRLDLWDPVAGRMVRFRDVPRAKPAAAVPASQPVAA